MHARFTIEPLGGKPHDVELNLRELIVAGWAGRDRAAIEHHIEELAAIGVPRPSAVPLYYRIAANQLTQQEVVQVVGPHSSGEAEVFVFTLGGELMVSIASDHTDRKLEAHSVALSKQLCVKPVARRAWRMADIAAHWDTLQLRSRIDEGGAQVLYQDGTLAQLRDPRELIAGLGLPTGALLPEGTGMLCGTVAAIGGIRPSTRMQIELHDGWLGRTLQHTYAAQVLPEVA